MTLNDVKMNMNRKVIFRGGEYILSGCIFRQNEKTGNYYYQAELINERSGGRSVTICKLDEVEEKNE